MTEDEIAVVKNECRLNDWRQIDCWLNGSRYNDCRWNYSRVYEGTLNNCWLND